MAMTLDSWLSKHPYLRCLSDFQNEVEFVLAGLPKSTGSVPCWSSHEEYYQAGIPLLHNPQFSLDFRPAEAILTSLVTELASLPMPEKLERQTRELEKELGGNGDEGHHAIAWMLGHDDILNSNHPGLLRYLGWTVLSYYLREVTEAFGRWRDEERWLRGYCPTCGCPPAMSQLVGTDPGRLRMLSCGSCRSLWRYRRIGCPFCEGSEGHRLPVLAIEGEERLRIDYCESCRGYLKTYVGQGCEALYLADWTTLHLDVLATNRGFMRTSASLYEL
jgi:FdhE protein